MDKLIQTLNGLKPAIAKQMTFVQDATRETVDYVRTGAVDAHRDVGQRREEDRKVDPYGQPARPNVVYGIVKRAEQELGLGKGKSKAKGATGAGDAGNGHGSSAVSGNGDVESGEITYVPHNDNSQLAQPSSSNTGVTMPGNTATQNLPHQSSFSTATQPAPPLPARPSEPASYVPPLPPRPQDHLPPSYTTVAQPSNYRDARDDVKNDTDSHPAFKATPERTDCISTSRPRSSSSASDSSLTLIPLGPGEFYVDLVPEQPPHEQGPMFGPAPETNRERANRYVKVVDDVTDEIAMGIAMGFLLGPDISMILDIIDAASGKDVKQARKEHEKADKEKSKYIEREARQTAEVAALEAPFAHAKRPEFGSQTIAYPDGPTTADFDAARDAELSSLEARFDQVEEPGLVSPSALPNSSSSDMKEEAKSTQAANASSLPPPSHAPIPSISSTSLVPVESDNDSPLPPASPATLPLVGPEIRDHSLKPPKPTQVKEMYNTSLLAKDEKKAFETFKDAAKELLETRKKLVKARDKEREKASVMYYFNYKARKKAAKKEVKEQKKVERREEGTLRGRLGF